jgi:hypothetical protein
MNRRSGRCPRLAGRPPPPLRARPTEHTMDRRRQRAPTRCANDSPAQHATHGVFSNSPGRSRHRGMFRGNACTRLVHSAPTSTKKSNNLVNSRRKERRRSQAELNETGLKKLCQVAPAIGERCRPLNTVPTRPAGRSVSDSTMERASQGRVVLDL